MKIKYTTFKIPKRKGGFRTIEKPDKVGMDFLKKLLTKLEDTPELKPSYFVHSFMKGRNIVTCARQHFGKKYIGRMDIEDFFGSIQLDKFVSVLYKRYSQGKTLVPSAREEFFEKWSSLLSLCFNIKDENVTYLPQGSPTSPFLSNSFLRVFDWTMAWYCFKLNITYNRYADDLFFSGDSIKELRIAMIYAKNALKPYNLRENVKKRKIMKQGERMLVLGIVLNEKFQVPRYRRRINRAIRHNTKNQKISLHQKGLLNFEGMVRKYDKTVKDSLTVCRKIAVAKSL